MGRFAQQSAAGTDYFLADALGSVRQITDSSGFPSMHQSFDPFGNLLSRTGAASSSFGFAGEWTDATGLQYLRARYYSMAQGRFMTRDLFPGMLGLPGTLQPYVYAINNPLLYTDPSGEFIEFIIIGIAGGILGGLGYYGLQQVFSDDPCAKWDWYQAAFWGGAGAVLGAALGACAYGGWQVGVQLGWWGKKVADYVLADGDPNNEAVAIVRAIQNGLYAIRNGLGQGYQTFRAFIYAKGIAGPGMAWHHIVNQTKANIDRLGAQVIHNTNNLIRLPHGIGSLHQRITNYYNSIDPVVTGSETLRVREWLQSQTFEAQWNFGIEILQRFGGDQFIIN